MPKDVAVPSTLKGEAASLWRSTFLSAWDGTCAKPKGRRGGSSTSRDACAAKIAWSQVKTKFKKGEGGKWVAKAGDPNIGPVTGSPDIGAGPPQFGTGFDLASPGEKGTTLQQWRREFQRALREDCRNAGDPVACARASANAAVGRLDGEEDEALVEIEEKGGPGSGHHGHAGRPGEIGGSLPSGEGPSQIGARKPIAGLEDFTDADFEEDQRVGDKVFLGYMRESGRHKWQLNLYGVGVEGGPHNQRVENLIKEFGESAKEFGEPNTQTKVVSVDFDREVQHFNDVINNAQNLSNAQMEGLEKGTYVPSALERKLDGMRRHKFLPADLEKKFPAIGETEGQDDPTVIGKWFHPWSNLTWYATEYDPKTGMFFGYVDSGPGTSELGYFDRREMAELRAGLGGLPIERDRFFKPTPLSEIRGPAQSPAERSIAPSELIGRAFHPTMPQVVKAGVHDH